MSILYLITDHIVSTGVTLVSFGCMTSMIHKFFDEATLTDFLFEN